MASWPEWKFFRKTTVYWFVTLILTCGAVPLSVARSEQQIGPDPERFAAMQAAYIFNIAKFFNWPDSPQREYFDPCLFGPADPLLQQQLEKGTQNRLLHKLP